MTSGFKACKDSHTYFLRIVHHNWHTVTLATFQALNTHVTTVLGSPDIKYFHHREFYWTVLV